MLRDTRGEGNQGALVAIVLLVLALFAVFFVFMRGGPAGDDIDIDIEIDSIPPSSLRPAEAPRVVTGERSARRPRGGDA